MGLLEGLDLYSGYGETEILHGVSVRLESGEIVAIIGPNGAGKSTLVKTIIGLLKPTKGRIVFEGRDITGRNPEALVLDGLAYIPQTNNTFPSLTVRDNLEMGAIIRRPRRMVNLNPFLLPTLFARLNKGSDAARKGEREVWTRAEFNDRVEDICAIFPNLRPKLDAKVSNLSGGEQQMVALAKTMVLIPRVLLIDEPSAGLAPKLVALVFEKIQQINDRGVAIILVEQNAKKALALADRGYVLEAGRNRYEGPGEALLHDPDVGRLYLGG
jgi:ABC-type branched-subunit amino acid transport system ATPase component